MAILSEILRRVKKEQRKPEWMGPCWIWQGEKRPDGYSKFSRRGVTAYAHRVVCGLLVESVDGLQVMHLCDEPDCVNPHHLVTGTPKDNFHDCMRKGRHSYGVKRPNAKLTESDVAEIIRRAVAGEHHKSIAKDYGISSVRVGKVARRQIWAHVECDVTYTQNRPSWKNLSQEQIDEIKRLYQSGLTQRQVATKVGYTQQTVSRALKR